MGSIGQCLPSLWPGKSDAGFSGTAQAADQWRGDAAKTFFQRRGKTLVMAGTGQRGVFPRFRAFGKLDDAAFHSFTFPTFLPVVRKVQTEILCQFAGHEVPAFRQDVDMVVKDLVENVRAGAEIGACGQGEAAVDL